MSLHLKLIIIAILFGGCHYTSDRSGVPVNTSTEMPYVAASLQPGVTNVHTLYQNSDFPAVSGNDLEQAIRSIPEFSSFILYRDGEIISEMYKNGGAANRPANIKSASKSILSALTGIALREGFIESIDDPLSGYLPGYFDGIDDSLKHQITIRHLLMMKSGLRSTSFGNYGAWVVSRDWVGYAIRGPQVHPPGRSMAYSTGDTHILSAVLSEASGMSTRQLAERYLFTPMNQGIGGWDRDPQGYFFGGNNMALSPYALLEFGRLYLNGGMYNGVQVLDPEWIQKSLTTYQHGISFNSRRHDYGYLWWHNTFGGHSVWFAWGYGGQYLFLIPEMDAVVVLTGNPDTRSRGMNNRIYSIMETTVIPYLAGSTKRD
ncbi:MAG: class C beta-lactamase-related serine hydrolase [Balneolaceae bacterium]|nr:MAG: class C beta-lactamase-related serine hydrolase [Balneolaceae bacterium]